MNNSFSSAINIIVIVAVTIILILCFIGIKVAIKVQKKQRKKLMELEKIVNEKNDVTFQVKDSLSFDEIKTIDDTIDPAELMKELYEIYLRFESKIRNFDTNLDDVLVGNLKDFYINKINNFKEKGYADITDNIDLVGYSISEFKKDKLSFKVNINCYNYKTIYDRIVSGSNSIRVSQIIIISYERVDGKWLISAYDKVYEKKLSN